MKKVLMLCLGLKRVCCHQGLNSQPRAWRSVLIFRAKCDTTQLSRCSNRKKHFVIICGIFLNFAFKIKTAVATFGKHWATFYSTGHTAT